jgi:dUTP pyrophosphatase
MALYIYTPDDALRLKLISIVENRRESDSGFDIPLMAQQVNSNETRYSFKLNIKVGALTEQNEPAPCLLVPRSSLSNTPYRLSNSIGLIDSGYRGEVQARVDIISPSEMHTIPFGTRYFQICRHNFLPWKSVVIVQFEEELPKANDNRESGGFGSTG